MKIASSPALRREVIRLVCATIWCLSVICTLPLWGTGIPEIVLIIIGLGIIAVRYIFK